jgi:hypothetical protein
VRRVVGEVGHQRSKFDRRFHESQRFGVAEDLTHLGRAVTTHEAPVRGRPDPRDQHRRLGDRPITIENDACVRAPLAVRPLCGLDCYGIDCGIDNPAMMLRCAVGEFDGGRRVDELRGIPGIGKACSREDDERVQPIVGRVHWRGVLEERDPAFDLVEFGSPMAHQRGRDQAQPASRVVDEITPRPHVTSHTLAPDLACNRSASAQPPRMSSVSWSEYGHRSGSNGGQHLRPFAVCGSAFPL